MSLRVFEPCMPQPCLSFAGKAALVLQYVEVFHSSIDSWLYLKTLGLDLAGKTCQDSTLAYFKRSYIKDVKSFITLGPGRQRDRRPGSVGERRLDGETRCRRIRR
jgi:hypothetical protein